ncbi:MAG TPA: hypothetical protein PKV93_01085 [Fervidobacterium sp.]|nr:hypothetical protein [Fervidobacterium sp.]
MQKVQNKFVPDKEDYLLPIAYVLRYFQLNVDGMNLPTQLVSEFINFASDKTKLQLTAGNLPQQLSSYISKYFDNGILPSNLTLNDTSSIITHAWTLYLSMLADAERQDIVNDNFPNALVYQIGTEPIRDFGVGLLKFVSYSIISALNYTSLDDVLELLINQYSAYGLTEVVVLLEQLTLFYILTNPEKIKNLLSNENFSHPFVKASLITSAMYTDDVIRIDSLNEILTQRLAETSDKLLQIQAIINQLHSQYIQAISDTTSPVVQSVINAERLGTPSKYLTSTEIADASHVHEEYLTADDIAPNAKYLVLNGERYSKEDFALANHKHEQYIKYSDLQNADFLLRNGQLYTAEDLAKVNHAHNYVPANAEVESAYAYKSEVEQTYPIVPAGHIHDGTYLNALLPKNFVASSTYKLRGKWATDFALANHTHDNYVTSSDTTFELATAPDDASKGAKGIVIYQAQKSGSSYTLANPKIGHVLTGTLTLSGNPKTISVPNVVFATCTIINAADDGSLPDIVYETQVEGEVQKIVGVTFVPKTKGSVSIYYTIFYEPEL